MFRTPLGALGCTPQNTLPPHDLNATPQAGRPGSVGRRWDASGLWAVPLSERSTGPIAAEWGKAAGMCLIAFEMIALVLFYFIAFTDCSQ